YNKFRAPSMSLVIPQFLLPLLAALAVQQIFFTQEGKEQLKKSFRTIIYILGGVFLLVCIFYLANDYSAGIDKQIIQAYTNPQNGDKSGGMMVVNALKSSRQAMVGAGIARTLGFILLVLGLLFLYLKNIIKPAVAVVLFL